MVLSMSKSFMVWGGAPSQASDMVVELAAWREGMQVDRLGLDEQYYIVAQSGFTVCGIRFVRGEIYQP